MRKLFLFVPFLVIGLSGSGQDLPATTDSLVIENIDSTMIQSYAARYNPRKALLFAAVLPGLGQVYNKKYWKLPLVYGGFYLIGKEGIEKNSTIYKKYRVYLFENLELGKRGENDVHGLSGLTTGQLRRIVDRARRERDFYTILMGGMYLLQIIDAHVDAHLKEFDLNPNLQVSIEPILEQNAFLGKQTGLSVIFRF